MKVKALGRQPKSKPSSQARVIETLKGPSSVKTNRPKPDLDFIN